MGATKQRFAGPVIGNNPYNRQKYLTLSDSRGVLRQKKKEGQITKESSGNKNSLVFKTPWKRNLVYESSY